MIDQTQIDDVKACAEKLLETAKAMYGVSQTMTANESDKETAKKIVNIEGYLELMTAQKSLVNLSFLSFLGDLIYDRPKSN